MRRPDKITILRSSWNNFTVVFERFPDGPATVHGLTYDEMLGAISSLTIPIEENGPLFRFEQLFLGPTEQREPKPEPPFETTVEAPAPQPPDKPRKRKRKQTMRERIEAWCKGYGIEVAVSNGEEHWQFRRRPELRKLAEWWPSTGRFVFDKRYDRAQMNVKGRNALILELERCFLLASDPKRKEA